MSKPHFPRRLFLAFVITALAGTALHFLYDLLPSPLTALFSPVNESIWEHVKLIYWPYLAAMFLVTGKEAQGKRGSWLFTLLVISVAMLLAGYVYHISLGLDNLVFDIVLYVFLMALGFWLPGRLNPKNARCTPVLLLVIALGAAIIIFTFLPPDHILFADLSGVNTWYTIPV